MPFPAFTIKDTIFILSLVSVQVFALAGQPIQESPLLEIEYECNNKEKCMLKQLNTSQCLTAKKCDLCGSTQVDDINFASLKKALQCNGLEDELSIYNQAGGVTILSSHETPSPDLSWDICEIEPGAGEAVEPDSDKSPDAGKAVEPDSDKSPDEKANDMSHCKEKDCAEQKVKFRLCSMDNTNENMECFDGIGVRSYPVKKGVHVLYFGEDISCKKCLLQMSYLDGNNEVLPIGCFPISIMPKKSVRKNKLKRFAEVVDNGSVSNITSSMEGGALEADKTTILNPDVVEEDFVPEETKTQILSITTKDVAIITAAPKPKHKSIWPINSPLLKPKIIASNVIQKPKPSTPKPVHTSAPKHVTLRPPHHVHAKATMAAGKAVVGTTFRTSRRPKVSTKRSLDHQVRPSAMTRHIEVDPVQRRPTASSTKSFDDMWKERMQEFEEKKKDRFQAFKSKIDPPSINDPFIKIPPENTFESKGGGCDVIKWSLVLQGVFFLWMCLCG